MAWTTPFPPITGVRLLVTILILVAVVVAGAGVEAASVSVTWNAPTTSADGTPLTDLAGYRIYLGTVLPTCPGESFLTVSSPTTAPASGETASADVTALSAGITYFARITAVDFDGNESACSSSVSGVAQTDLDVTPTATTSFGSVTVDGTVDRAFTVENTGAASISGAASVGAPFSIVSGNSFSLEPGDSQTVTVRFQPTTVGSFAGNVTFIAGSDSVSRGVSGSATADGTSPTAPSSPAAPPAASGSPSVTQLGADAGGVTFAITWAPASGAASYSYAASFNDGTGTQQGTITAPSMQLRMPYHVSGAAMGGFVCIRSTSATGLQSTDQSCSTMQVPARTTSSAPSVPVASSLSPTGATAGSAGLTLTVNGGGFVASSVVRWNGASRSTTFVSASQLRAAITASDIAASGSVAVSVVTPAPGGGTSETVTFTITAPPAPPPTAPTAPTPPAPPAPPAPPPAPGAPSVTLTAADASGVTFSIAWGAVSGATSYRYIAGFNDGSALRQGTVTSLLSFQLQMPYHASGADFGATVCIRSVSATGLQSTDQSCSAMSVPARPVAPPPPPGTEPPPDYGWGTG